MAQQTQQSQQQQQQQQRQGPTLSLFGNRGGNAQSEQRPGGSTVQGVKIDVNHLNPTTKFENCVDLLKKEIEDIDTFILNQIHMCNEVSDVLPAIKSQSALIPNDVEFVQGKLDTLQEALENDASDIDYLRQQAMRDEAEAKLAFRSLDTLLLPVQYQLSPAERLWGSQQQSQSTPRQALRSTRGGLGELALPDNVEADTGVTDNVAPSNLIDFFSQRADDMGSVTEGYRKNLKEIEDHLRGVEASLIRQMTEISSRSRGSEAAHAPTSKVGELAGTLGDVETAILGVAGRLGGVREEVQELILGPVGAPNVSNGW